MEVAPGDNVPHAQVLASGVAMNWALEGQRRLADEWQVAADVWSVTSWNELRREALAADEWNLMHPGDEPLVPYVTRRLRDAAGPVVAVSDYMRAVQDQIAPYVPGDWASLGTDGFGMSDTRAALRRHFKVDAQSIVVNVLTLLARRGEIGWDVVKQAHERYRLDDVNATTAEEAGGET
jgi:pyruvate dehydrogenase E1 component